MPVPFVVDSHCHLDFPDFEAERDEIVARAEANGVQLMLTISTRLSRFAGIDALTARYSNVYASVGTHPLSAGEEPEVPTSDYERLSAGPKVVAIGEAGLDYFHDRTPRGLQEAVFRRQIAAARATQLPLVIHSRDCDDDMIRILEDETGQGAFAFVLHCFSAGRALAEAGLALGGYVSFSGILAFKRSDELRTIAADVPLDRLLVETDAPYLAPPPHRGERNEPAYVRHTLKALAEVKDLTPEVAAKATSDNFFRLFRKVPDPRPSPTADA